MMTESSAMISSHTHPSSQQIPVVDLKDLAGKGHAQIVKTIGEACEKWGFFQVTNHGVASSVIRDMMEVSCDFFELPTEEKMNYFSADNLQPARFGSTYSNLSADEVLEWREFLKCRALPISDFIHAWPSKPSNFRGVTAKYATEVAALAAQIFCAISESLGLESQRLFEENCMQQQIVMLNHYPACLNADLVNGLCAHSDPSTINVLLQDEVGGLEVLNEGRWLPVEPLPGAFVINIGDQTQLLTNGRYKSVEHRARVNSERKRFSIATFFSPAADSSISAVPELLASQPPLYKKCVYEEFVTTYYSYRMKPKYVLESLRLRG